LAEQIGLELPVVGAETEAMLRAGMPDFIPVSNPMDLTAQALVDPDLYRRTLQPLLEDDDFAAVVIGIIQTDEATASRKFPFIIDAVKQITPNKPVIFAGLDEGAPFSSEYIAGLRAIGVPYFPSADRAFRALRQLSRLAERDFTTSGIGARTLDLPVGVVPEYRAKELLAPVGIPFPKGGFAATVEQARAVAAGVGYPVVLKAQAAALSHKSDAGGVILNIADEAALTAAWDRLYANVAAYDAGITLDGGLIEAMGARGLELIVGAKNDPEWGPVILVGFGGVTAELLHDVRLLPHDLPREAVIAALRSLKQGALLDGYRGSPALDVEAVADLVVGLGSVLAGTPAIREIDLNPVVVYPRGQGVVALDALILADG
ncbi:MAG: CoA-binding protein, partial [Sphingomonadales bacterium]